MDKPLPDDFDPNLRGDMNITGTDIPKSTIVVGGLLWSILFAMQAWHLITTLNMKDRQTEQSGDIRVVTLQQNTMSDDIKELKKSVESHERRLTEQERRR